MNLRAQKIEELVEELIRDGLITSSQLEQARARAMGGEQELDEILIGIGAIPEKVLITRLARKLGIANISLLSYQPDPKALKLVTPDQAVNWQIIPLFEVEGKLTVATANPLDLENLDDARQKLSLDIECILASRNDVKQALKKHYGEKPINKKADQKIEIVHYGLEEQDQAAESEDHSTVQVLASNTVSIVDALLQNAFLARASDIHMEPTRDGLKVRIRVDGILEQLDMIPSALQAAALSRIKIIGGMDVAEHRIPQDGRTHLKIKGRDIDLRIATYPTIFGESAAIRLLSKKSLITLEDIGMLPRDLEILKRIISKPHGIFLVTGPTGSGKSTTLYAALQKVNRVTNHVLSVEDPVENEIEGVGQTQINLKAGVTFATALRASLREDPDIMMVGEIRDQETAEIAFRAAMTGHLVLSTLHTNSPSATVGRLVDLGLEPYLIASSLLGVMAQRLVRRICQSCREVAPIPPELLFSIREKGIAIHTAFKGAGCSLCGMRGFKGRIGLFEIIELDDEIRILINSRAPEVRIREKSTTMGFHTILEDGIEKIRMGLTTPDEVLRVSGEK